jgi:glycerophosphoryl diester phosphodiesterase
VTLSLERRDGRMLRIGHRGAAALAPENTLRSLRAAVEAGVDLIEFDVLELRDGELVLAHSNDLFEVTHGAARGTVRGQTLSALRELAPDLPLLADALAFFVDEAPHVGLHVDLKSVGVEAEVVAALGRFGLCERTLVTSFFPGGLREVARIESRVRTGISFPKDRLRVSGRRGSRSVVRAALYGLRHVTPALVGGLFRRSGATVLSLHHALLTPRVVRRAHAHGAAVIAWTIEDARELERVDAAGADAAVVDDPRLFGLRSE